MQIQRINSSQPYYCNKMCNQSNQRSHNVTFGINAPNPNAIYGRCPNFIYSINGVEIRKIRPNSYITSSNLTSNACKILKDNGIERIIDLSNWKNLEYHAKNAGLDYHFINLFENAEDNIDLNAHDIFFRRVLRSQESPEAVRSFIDNFTELINLVKEDNTVVCTDYKTKLHPTHGTSGLFELILTFDRKEVFDCFDVENMYVSDIYEHLTEADKQALGFDALSDKNFKRSLCL